MPDMPMGGTRLREGPAGTSAVGWGQSCGTAPVPARQGESGQTTIEWLGIAAIVVAILLGLLTAAPALGGDVTDRLRCLLQTVTGGDGGGCGGGDAGPGTLGDAGGANPGGSSSGDGDGAPELTPLEQATQGDYIAIGDSFSSGEGAGDYGESDCNQSANAYPVLIGEAYDFGGNVINVTCSGAVIGNVNGADGQHGEPPQITAITDDASLITVGISGNDTGWVDVVSSCATDGAVGGDICTDPDAIRDRMTAALEDYDALLKEIMAGDHDARVIAVGYPRFFPDPPEEDWTYGCHPFGCLARISTEEQAMMNELFREYNDRLREIAEANGVEFVDPHDAFDGCELTTADACMNGLSVSGNWGWPPVAADSSSFHPNAQGQQALADLIQEQIENP